MIQSLNYFIREGFPGTRAHHIQIARQAAAFAAEGLSTTLIVPRLPDQPVAQITKEFGLSRDLDMKAISMGRSLPKVARDLLYRRALVKFVREAVKTKGLGFYGRSSGKLPMPVVLKERQKVPAFIEVHSADFEGGWEEFLPMATGLITISQALRRELVKKGLPEARILVAHDGVDLEAYSEKKTGRLPPVGPWIVFTGHLYPDRGAEVLLEAMTQLPKEIRCAFVGGAKDDIERVTAKAKSLKLGARVHFTGMKTPAEVPAYQMSADVLVMPYKGNLSTREWCSPLKLFEYMAAGAPIVSSNLPSIREVLRQNENSLLVPPDDPKALADSISRLLSDRKLAQSIAKTARQEVEQYTWKHRARRIIEFMRGLAR